MFTTKYTTINDLAYLAKKDSCAFEVLYLRMQSLISAWVKPYHIPGASREDIMQEASLGLLNAVNIYDPQYGNDFMSLAKTCILRHVFNVLKKELRKKNMAFYNGLRFEQPLGDNNECTLGDIVPSVDNAYEDLIVSIDIAKFLSSINFSKLEDAVFRLRLDEDMGIQDISNLLGCSYKRVDNALQRIRSKLSCRIRRNKAMTKTS